MFSFCFSFSFWFLFLLFKSFCIFVNSTWPRGAIDGQLSLTWPRSAIAFSFANFPRDLVVPQKVNSLLIGLEVPEHLEIWHLALFDYVEFNVAVHFSCFWVEMPFWANFIQKIKFISLSSNLVPALIQTCRIQWWYSLFLFLIRNTLFGQIWSKKSKLSVEAEIWYLD